MMAADSSELPAILGGQPFFPDGPPTWPVQDEAVDDALKQMAADGSWGRYWGPHGDRLTERLQEVHGCEHVLLCCSGRTAVELALRGLGIGDGDEIAMAAYDFHSNFACIHEVGATPVLIDVQVTDAQLDVSLVDSSLSKSTKAVIGSHLHGGIVDMPSLRMLADEHGLAIIEDACQASGAIVAGRPAAMWGDVGILSFGGTKLLTAGRGGALLTNRDDVIQRIRRYLRGDNHAYALSEMQAAVLLPQLDRLGERHLQRAQAVAEICAVLDGCPGLSAFPSAVDDSSPAYYKAGFFYDPSEFEGSLRDQFVAALHAEGLALDAGLPALHAIHSPRRFRASGHLTTAARAGETLVGLHHPILLDATVDWSRFRHSIERIRKHASEIQTVHQSPR